MGNLFSTENLIYLESVGTFIDPKNAVTYASNKDLTPDLDSGVLISMVSNEWISSLSEGDYNTIVNL